MNTITEHALSLEKELAGIDGVLKAPLSLLFEQDSAFESIYDLLAPGTGRAESPFPAAHAGHGRGYRFTPIRRERPCAWGSRNVGRSPELAVGVELLR